MPEIITIAILVCAFIFYKDIIAFGKKVVDYVIKKYSESHQVHLTEFDENRIANTVLHKFRKDPNLRDMIEESIRSAVKDQVDRYMLLHDQDIYKQQLAKTVTKKTVSTDTPKPKTVRKKKDVRNKQD